MTTGSTADLTTRARAWAAEDPDEQTRAELEGVIGAAERGEETDLADRFAGTLEFGTAGLRGALGYRDAYASAAVDHVLAIESDSGVFDPMQIGFTGSASARQVMEDIGVLLRPLNFPAIGRGGGGADIGPIAQVGQVPMLALMGDAERYFQIHHTPADTVERIDPAEVARATAAIAVLTWVVAEMDERLPR